MIWALCKTPHFSSGSTDSAMANTNSKNKLIITITCGFAITLLVFGGSVGSEKSSVWKFRTVYSARLQEKCHRGIFVLFSYYCQHHHEVPTTVSSPCSKTTKIFTYDVLYTDDLVKILTIL